MSTWEGRLAEVRAVIFDVDGVLLDARPSYHAVAEEAARRALERMLDQQAARAVAFDRAREIPQFKAAGHFNDDWEMSRGIALLLLLRARLGAEAPSLSEFLARADGVGLRGALAAWADLAVRELAPERAKLLVDEFIPRVCCALYGGDRCRALFGIDASAVLPDAPAQGLWTREQPLASAATLAAIASRFALALFTGRNPGEAALALERLELKVPSDHQWVADGRPRKPDPEGLIELCAALLPEGGQALFLGDTADDLAAATQARDRGAPLLYAHIEQPGATEDVLSRLLAANAPPQGRP